MNPESASLAILFSLAAVAFIGVLNARGPWRTAVAAVLALLCLAAALWKTADYRAARRVAAPDSVTTSSGPDFGPSSEGAAAGITGEPGTGALLSDLLASARALRDSMAAEDPALARALSDSEYQAFEVRATGYLERARFLREQAARAASEAPQGMEEPAEALNAALQAVATAARDLRAFFRASGRDEERALGESFRRGIDGADAPLRRAESKASALSPDFAP